MAKMLCAFLFLGVSITASTQKPPLREYNVKAAFLYNFTQFVEWPIHAINNDKPFVIGILGDDPFRLYIDQIVNGATAKGRPIEIRRYKSLNEIDGCHILFISASEAANLKEVLAVLANKNILTVSDIPEFARTGGMIRFMTMNNKIKLQINPAAAKAAELDISSKLLRLADIVGT